MNTVRVIAVCALLMVSAVSASYFPRLSLEEGAVSATANEASVCQLMTNQDLEQMPGWGKLQGKSMCNFKCNFFAIYLLRFLAGYDVVHTVLIFIVQML